MNKTELKRAILAYLMENRAAECLAAFGGYIFDQAGHYLPGGQAITDFIYQADLLIYGA